MPWAPGGSTDILARIVGQQLFQSMGQPVIIENRTGASGNIGTAAAARAAPDGYTILFNTMSVHTMNHALFASMPFDGVKDFSPITLLAYVTNTMVVHPSVPANNVAEFIAYAKANPGKIAYASSGPGSTNHLCAALLEKMAGIEMLHVPYRGGAPAVTDTVAGQCQLFFTAGTQSLAHVKAGRLKLLAVTEESRSPLLPDVPAVVGDRAGLRNDRVVRGVRSGRHAGRHRHQAQHRDHARAVPARREAENGGHRRRGEVIDARRIERAHAPRRRQMGRDHQEHRDRDAVTSRPTKKNKGEGVTTHAVPNSTGSAPPKLKAPANACDCHMHIYDAARFPPARPGPQSRMQSDAAVAQYRLLQQRRARHAP